tara:strand:- start:967 stop:1560 length:594 start_codon:yes stop_codon:yes gene_type:complete
MASELHVDAIKHSGGTSAMTIDSTGRVTTPARPAFSAKTVNAQEWGQNHSDTVYDTNYHTPIPIWLDANTTTDFNVGGGTLSFETHPIGSGKYLKYVVPVTGIYIFTMHGSLRLQVANDYASTGFQVNSGSEGGSSTFPTVTINGYQAYQADAHMSLAGTALMSLTAGDYIVPYSTSIAEAYADSNFGIRVSGYLLG